MFEVSNLLTVMSLIALSRRKPIYAESPGPAAGCPMRLRMFTANLMHRVTLGSYNDTIERRICELNVNHIASRQQWDEESRFYRARGFLQILRKWYACAYI